MIQSRDTEPTTASAIEGSQKLILVIYIGLALPSCPGNISTLKWTTIMIASNAVAARQQFLDVLPGFNLMLLYTSWSLLPVQCLTYFVDLLLNLMISVLNWGPLIMYLALPPDSPQEGSYPTNLSINSDPGHLTAVHPAFHHITTRPGCRSYHRQSIQDRFLSISMVPSAPG